MAYPIHDEASDTHRAVRNTRVSAREAMQFVRIRSPAPIADSAAPDHLADAPGDTPYVFHEF
jgi:hypothetical protein